MITMAQLILISSVTSYLIIALIWQSKLKRYFLDIPNERSAHTVPVPRIGGIGVLFGITLSLAYAQTDIIPHPFTTTLLTAIAILLIVTIIDDIFQIHQIYKLMAQALIAIVLVQNNHDACFKISYDSYNYAIMLIFFVVAVVWTINMYNLMDGIDGNVAFMSTIGFGCLAIIGHIKNEIDFFEFNTIIAAASMGFIPHNFSLAKSFIGDLGANLLGTLMAISAFWGISKSIVTPLEVVVIFLAFYGDATITVVRRIITQGIKFWKPHNTHLYQRVKSRISTRIALLIQVTTMILGASLVLSIHYLTIPNKIILNLTYGLFIAIYIISWLAIDSWLTKGLHRNHI